MKVAGVVFVVLLAFAFSCGPINYEGTKIDASKRDQLVKNKTTAQEVQAMFGKPYKVEKMEGGKEKYIYYYKYEEYKYWNTLPKGEFQKMDVNFKDGVVTDYSYITDAIDPMRLRDR